MTYEIDLKKQFPSVEILFLSKALTREFVRFYPLIHYRKEHHTRRLVVRIYTFLAAKFYLLVKRFRDRNRQLQALYYPAEMNLHLKIHH